MGFKENAKKTFLSTFFNGTYKEYKELKQKELDYNDLKQHNKAEKIKVIEELHQSELEKDQFLHRKIYKEIPPKVEYTLSELGESFIPILNVMMEWSETNLCPDYINPYTNQEEVDKER